MRHLYCDGLHWKYVFVWLHHVSHPHFLCLLPISDDHLPSTEKEQPGLASTSKGCNDPFLEHTYGQIVQPAVKCFSRKWLRDYNTDISSISAVSIISVILVTWYHLKDTNITEQTPAATTELEERLRATQIQTEQAAQHFGGNFKTFSSIGGDAHACSFFLSSKRLQ